ncbi:MAG: AraC family transcriptional regulator [Pseudomonadota bacterium]
MFSKELVQSGATVSTPYAYSYFQTCLDFGADEQSLLDILDIQRDDFNNTLIRYPCDRVLDMIAEAERQTGNKSIGLISGRNFRPSTFANVGLALISARSLRHALEVNGRYQRLTQEFGTTRLEVRDGSAFVRWFPYIQDANRLRPITEAVYAGYVTVGRWLLWHYDEDALIVHFRHSKPCEPDPCADYFGCEVLYNQPFDSLSFKANLADKPLPQANPELLALLEERLTRALRHHDNRDQMSSQVYETLQHGLGQGLSSVEHVAALIGVSARQLSYRLQLEGTSFTQVLKKVRMETAGFYLGEGKKSLTEIALLLGYSEQSAFTRAYKSWYGTPPSVR